MNKLLTKTSLLEEWERWERVERQIEAKHLKLVGRVLIRQRLFPERAYAILNSEQLYSMDDKDLKCIIDSYNATEEDIAHQIR